MVADRATQSATIVPQQITLTVRFHGALNDFLPRERREISFDTTVSSRASIKDVVESLGVPHTEIEALLVDGHSVGFGTLLRTGQFIDAYPVFATPATKSLIPLRPPVPDPARFVLDTHLGQLAVYLRMLGFDTLYRNNYADDELAVVSSSDERILLTRDRGLLKRSLVTHGYYMRETNPPLQAAELLRRYALLPQVMPFHRCIRCNGTLRLAAKDEVAPLVAPRTLQFFDEFRRCRECGKVYWKGSHYEQMRGLVAQLTGGN